jgi:hypothetical protein
MRPRGGCLTQAPDVARRGARGRCRVSDEDTPDEPRLSPAAIVAALNHQVRYVITGAFAAIAQQAPIPATRDIDFTPDTSQDNLARLPRAVTDLGAKIRTEAVPEGLPFSHDATSLAAAAVWNLICSGGEFHISFHPSGFAGGYAQLEVNARRLRVEEVEVVVADLDDVIRSKEAAGRPKDLRVLPSLYRHLSARRAQREALLIAPVLSQPRRRDLLTEARRSIRGLPGPEGDR